MKALVSLTLLLIVSWVFLGTNKTKLNPIEIENTEPQSTEVSQVDLKQLVSSPSSIKATNVKHREQQDVPELLESGSTGKIIALLDDGSLEVDAKDSSGNTLLMNAMDYNNIELAFALIDRGANLKAVNEQGLSSLALASLTGDFRLYKKIAGNQSDINPTIFGKKTVLMNAALSGHFEMVKFILDRTDIDLEQADDLGQTPLYLAVLGGHEKVVKLLLSKQADPLSRTEDGQTPLSLAKKLGSNSISTALERL
jgi:ankyrin repeat protein